MGDHFNQDVNSEDPEDRHGGSLRSYLHGFGATGISVLVHLLAVLALALITFEKPLAEIARLIVTPPPERVDDPPVEIELDPEMEIMPPENIAMFTSAPVMSIASTPAAASAPALDMKLVEKADAPEIRINAPTIGMPDSTELIEAVPDGDVKGEAREVVDSYATAVDRLAQELIWLLDKGPVLAVWCFDQSESMKDDQREIRDRIENVYLQLGLNGKDRNQALLTAVTSYGSNFIDHTKRKPTANGSLISAAIDSVPIDKSGEEMMCSAVGQAITTYRDNARRGRQMAVILVTDESGDRENNGRFLEEAIKTAKAARAKIYVLGRESVFGYPYAFIRWRHPQTKRMHWLKVDRGPETGFPEQLQTNGFRRRFDSFSSGFGPYEQARLARETNGIFFMLPSVESNLVAAEKHRYDLEALRPYRPDLSAREQVFRDRKKYPLRTVIWQVIQDLNPYAEASKKNVELRMEFSLELPKFVQQARQAQSKAKMHLGYMAEAEEYLIAQKKLREQEADPRWQANYDIILAQLIAYQARVYEYGVALEAFINKPRTAPAKKGERILHNWDIRTVGKTRTEEAKPYIERAKEMFAQIKQEHPGSPWAARADWELRRGFGVDFAPDYDLPYVKVKNPTPIPKL